MGIIMEIDARSADMRDIDSIIREEEHNDPIATAEIASDEQFVVDNAVEEVVPFLGRAAGVFEHLLQFVHAVVCQCGHRFVVSGVHGDDAAVAQIIIVGDDCMKKLRVLFKNFGNKFNRTDVCDCRHQAAFASIV